MHHLLRRLWYLLNRRRLEAELDEEMAFHRAMTSPARFCSGALAADRARDVWIAPWFRDIERDLRFGVRLLARERGFTAAVVLVLGLGLGIASLQFVLVDAICLRGLPIPRVDRVLFLGARDAQARDATLSYREFEFIRDNVADVHAAAAYAVAPAVLGDDDRAPDRALAAYASAPLFDILGEPPRLGRAFEPADDRPGAPLVTILTTGVWQTRYGGDPHIIGRIVRVNGTPATVVGVAAGRFRFPGVADLWLPLAAMPGITEERRGARALSVAARVRDGISIGDVRGELHAVSARLSHDYPATNTGVTVTAVPINERYSGRITDTVWLTFVGVGIVVLLISCANAAILVMIRAVRRGHEIAVRASLGASRGRITRQLLVESALLAIAGAGAGALLAAAGLHLVNALVPENTLAYWITFVLDRRAFAAMGAMGAATVCVFGLAPALHVARTDVSGVLNAGGSRGTGSIRGRRWTTSLLTIECGLTMVMLATLVLGVRSVRDAGRQYVAVNPAHVLTTWLTLPADRYRSDDARLAFFDALESRAAALPGAPILAVATALPLGGASPRLLAIDGRPIGAADSRPTVWSLTVSSRYFAAVGVSLVRGRAFDAQDGRPGHGRVIVNERLVEMFFAQTDPIGQHIRLAEPSVVGGEPPALTIVGVAPTIRQRPQVAEPDPIVYLPLAAAPPVSALMLVRSAGDAAALAAPFRETVRALDAELPLYRTMPMEEALDASQWNGRVSSLLLYVLSAAAVVLAAMGLYAVMAHSVEQRTREIGIRVALGARRARLIQIVAARAAAHLAMGVAAGLACVVAFEWLVSRGGGETGNRVTGLRITDPLTVVAAVALLAVITLVATLRPAWRATRVDPVVALRHD